MGTSHATPTTLDLGMRIGELAARVGLSAHTLRAWERRYGLLHPMRTVGGYRLYGAEDERRVRAVLELRSTGVPVSRAASIVLRTDRAAVPHVPENTETTASPQVYRDEFTTAIFAALATFDSRAADAALDLLLSRMPLVDAVDEAIIPFLIELGQRWQAGTISIAQEHFCSSLLRRRALLLSAADAETGPLAVLAAPEGERHDLPLILFAMLLSHAGWRIRQLGADTPVPELMAAAAGAQLVVVASTSQHLLEPHVATLRRLSRDVPVAIAGHGASTAIARRSGAIRLPHRQRQALEVANSIGGHR